MALGETPGRIDGAGESMSDLTAEQLFKINELHMKTVQEENMLTKQSATLQEDTADAYRRRGVPQRKDRRSRRGGGACA